MITALIFDFDGLIVDTETPDYRAWQEVFADHGLDLTLDVWALNVLDAAAALGLRVGLASSSSWAWVIGFLDRLGLRGHFAAVCTADDVARTKPEPDLYLAALERLGVAPGQAVALEDSPNGVRAAQAAGMRAVAVPNPVTARMDLGHADLVLSGLDALPLPALLARIAEPTRPQ